MKIVAVTNIKGGVGKTTTAVNLAYLSADGGRATLLWDLDPQGAATYLLRCEPNEHASVIASTRAQFPELLTTEVPYSSEIERMSERRAPLPSYSPRSGVGQIYSALWMEIEARMTHRPSAAATAPVHAPSS